MVFTTWNPQARPGNGFLVSQSSTVDLETFFFRFQITVRRNYGRFFKKMNETCLQSHGKNLGQKILPGCIIGLLR